MPDDKYFVASLGVILSAYVLIFALDSCKHTDRYKECVKYHEPKECK